MSGTITVSAALRLDKTGASISGNHQIAVEMAGEQAIGNIQSIDFAAAEALDLGDVTTIGYVFIRNLDATHFVTIDKVNTMNQFTQKLLPGEFILLKPVAATIYAQADTAVCALHVVALEL